MCVYVRVPVHVNVLVCSVCVHVWVGGFGCLCVCMCVCDTEKGLRPGDLAVPCTTGGCICYVADTLLICC